MSAIFGIWHFDDKEIREIHIERMKESLLSYGKDDQDVEIDKSIALGSCLHKLSIPSQEENLIIKHENIILVADAHIYNRDELINDHKLTNHQNLSNQKLLLLAYLKWGKDCPIYINGDFTMAIWEKDKHQLTLIRDHLGVRPLYYFHNDSVFVFSTDYRSILSLPFVPKKLDESILFKLLSNSNKMEAESTYYDGIKRVPQAHVFTVSNKDIAKKKYWSPGSGQKISYNTENEYFKALTDLVSDAISRRIKSSDLKIGAQMSGGLDSSVIAIMANRDLKKQNKKLPLFSWSPSFKVFEKQQRDERQFIEDVCNQEKLSCSYYDAVNNSKDIDKIRAIELSETAPFYQELDYMKSEGVRLILSGWGGDQGISHRANLFELFVHGYFKLFFQESLLLSEKSPLKLGKIILSNTIMKFIKLKSDNVSSKVDPINLTKEEFYDRMITSSKKNLHYFNLNPIKHLESGNIQTRTELSAWLGAEYNVQYLFPFLDYRVIDFAMSIPKHMFYKNGINRYVFRKAFEEILPRELCYYVPKDDVARLTYYIDHVKNDGSEKLILNEKLNRELFAPYISFDKVQNLQNLIEQQDNDLGKLQFKKRMHILYNLQKIIKQAENNGLIKERQE
ncbi:asparagine synthase-related protein [Metabacillus litoralis]|uniref:asparagine synthase-related protein n=1 Tax=Metabacillus litoralis TaxID=152268 RepID=UPI001CFDACD1|nr:asparagine synthase-related protein [Metabacillus litoralis]